MDNGADPSMVNSKGYSAVHYAAYHGNKQNLELVCFFCLRSQHNLSHIYNSQVKTEWQQLVTYSIRCSSEQLTTILITNSLFKLFSSGNTKLYLVLAPHMWDFAASLLRTIWLNAYELFVVFCVMYH